MDKPTRCKPRNLHKTWLTKEQAKEKASDYGLRFYSCYDHYHLGHKHVHTERAVKATTS